MQTRAFALALGFASLTAMVAGCAPTGPDESEPDATESVDDSDAAVTAGSVAAAVSNSCSTTSVKGLSLQIIAEANCIKPGAYAKIPNRSNLSVGAAVFAYLEQPARDRLVATLDANPSRTMQMNSGLRTVAQQYLLYRWAAQGRCGISIAAKPGRSNHETGLALDISSASTWKTSLGNHGFHYAGSADPVHFDYVGTGAVDHRGLDVLAFQRLWNDNHPNDVIAEDGDYGPQTEGRLKQAPAEGFAQGASCQQADVVCDADAGEMCG